MTHFTAIFALLKWPGTDQQYLKGMPVYKMSRIDKPIEDGEKGKLGRYRVSFWSDGNVLTLVHGDGCKTL